MRKYLVLAAAFFCMFIAFNNKTEGGDNMIGQLKNAIFPKGDKGPSGYFTGTAWVKMLVTDDDRVYNSQVYDVRFEPGARTKWHSHPGGQLLLVTDGSGYYQEKDKTARSLKQGDVVEIPPDVVHWHGAAPDSWFVHIGISAATQKGPAEWFPEVTDEEYNAAVK